MRHLIAALIPLLCSSLSPAEGLPASTIVIDTVEVGDPGNIASPIIPFNPETPDQTTAVEFVGRVDYV